MAINYPTTLDTTTQFPPITSTTNEDDSGFEHDIQHSNLNSAVVALETKVGITNSTDKTSLDSKVSINSNIAAMISNPGGVLM